MREGLKWQTKKKATQMNPRPPKKAVGAKFNGEIHTNEVENFWSLLKRGIVGSYHHVSPKYLPLYLDEFVSRFNARDLENGDYIEKVLKGCVKNSNGQPAADLNA